MKTTRLGFAVIAVLFVVGITFMLRYSRGLSVDRTAVSERLFAPYRAALTGSPADRDAAWTRYTTDHYRRIHPLGDWRAVFDTRLHAHGAIESIDCPRMTGVRRAEGGSFVVAHCDVHFADGDVHHVMYSLVDAGGELRIDTTREGGTATAW